MLFSEPKIPQFAAYASAPVTKTCFSAHQRAENSSIWSCSSTGSANSGFSALQRAENSSIVAGASSGVSSTTRFSALQRAENSSIILDGGAVRPVVGFSALQRAENSSIQPEALPRARRLGFSALQRAENSSMSCCTWLMCGVAEFQCSSASRKFLNLLWLALAAAAALVSVLFSEPKIPQSTNELTHPMTPLVSVLFSEPKIPQSTRPTTYRHRQGEVSVLFSEPKIPQFLRFFDANITADSFSALQRAENSSIV